MYVEIVKFTSDWMTGKPRLIIIHNKRNVIFFQFPSLSQEERNILADFPPNTYGALAHCLDPNTRKTPPIYAIFGGNKYKPVIINQGNYLLRLIPSDVINMYELYRRGQ